MINHLKLPQMLSIKEAAQQAQLSPYFVRQLVLKKNRNIKFIKSGKKYLINFESLIDFLNRGESEPESQNNVCTQKIKKVEA